MGLILLGVLLRDFLSLWRAGKACVGSCMRHGRHLQYNSILKCNDHTMGLMTFLVDQVNFSLYLSLAVKASCRSWLYTSPAIPGTTTYSGIRNPLRYKHRIESEQSLLASVGGYSACVGLPMEICASWKWSTAHSIVMIDIRSKKGFSLQMLSNIVLKHKWACITQLLAKLASANSIANSIAKLGRYKPLLGICLLLLAVAYPESLYKLTRAWVNALYLSNT